MADDFLTPEGIPAVSWHRNEFRQMLQNRRHRVSATLVRSGMPAMPTYMIIESKVLDQNMYQQYITVVPETVKSFGGRYLARGNNVTPWMGDWKPERIIILEFPSKENISRWLSSPEYQAIKNFREAGAETKAIIIEGDVD
jgi:uncharacterized protein (DUF1330 family)